MARKSLQYQEKQLSHSQSTYDFNSSRVVGDRRERQQQDQQMIRRRPLSAAPLPSSSGVSEDRDRLGYLLRRLPSIPQIDSGAHSLTSSMGDLDLSPTGALLIQGFSEAIKSGEESARDLRKAEAEKNALRDENRQLKEQVRVLQQALGRINSHCGNLRRDYLKIPPSEVLNVLEYVETLSVLNSTALLSSAAHNGEDRSGRDGSRRASSGKNKQQPRKSGTDADAENTSSSSSPSLTKHQSHEAQNRIYSDDMASSKEEVCHQGSSTVCPVNTDVD